jgi:hypothetical protein
MTRCFRVVDLRVSIFILLFRSYILPNLPQYTDVGIEDSRTHFFVQCHSALIIPDWTTLFITVTDTVL